MRRPMLRVTWIGDEGRLTRYLELSSSCPWCKGLGMRRLDTIACDSTSAGAVVPAECTKCFPGTFYALPRRVLLEQLVCIDEEEQLYGPARRPSLLERLTKWMWPVVGVLR
jgi:hypothetical protein